MARHIPTYGTVGSLADEAPKTSETQTISEKLFKLYSKATSQFRLKTKTIHL